MKILLVALLVISGCSLSGEDKKEQEASIITGHWFNLVLPQISGNCCSVTIDLIETDGRVTGNGTVIAPHEQRGYYYEYAVDITGTYSGTRLNLTLTSGIRAASARGDIENGNLYKFRFSGFGEVEDLTLRKAVGDHSDYEAVARYYGF